MEEVFVCPISMSLMRDPVILSSGHSYEREAIIEWLRVNNTDPMTNVEVDGVLTPNITLKSAIGTLAIILSISFR